MSKYLKLTYKLVWFEYLDRKSIDISSILVFWIYFRYFRHLLLTIYVYFQVFWQLKNILCVLDVFNIY